MLVMLMPPAVRFWYGRDRVDQEAEHQGDDGHPQDPLSDHHVLFPGLLVGNAGQSSAWP